MPVEIPVIIDIDKAFQDAAAGVGSAIKPLQRAVSEAALNVELIISEDETRKLSEIKKLTEDGAFSMSRLQAAINDANSELARLALSGDKVKFTAFLEAKHYLQDLMTASTVASKTIDGLANTLQGLRAKLSAARQSLESTSIDSPEWKKAAEDVHELEVQLRNAEKAAQEISANRAKVDFSPYISKATEKVIELRDHVRILSEQLRGLMSKKEASFFPTDPEAIEKYQRVAVALQQAQDSLNRMTGFQQHIQELSTVNIELLRMREHYKQLEESSLKMSTSIDGYRARISDLNAQWRQLTAEQRFTSDGKMAAEGRRLYELAKKETIEFEKQSEELSEILQKENKRNRENSILNSTVKSISALREKERVLIERLNKAEIGSSQYNQLKKDLAGVRAELDRVNGGLDNTNSRLATLIKNSIRLLALHTGTRFIRNIREVTAEFELQRVALGSIIQDTERAESLFRQIKAAAIQSPFEIKDLVSYTKQLSAYQIETDKLFDTTMKLADVSAGLGVDMGRLILAYGQVRAAAVLRGQELRQFTEAGIPLVEKLAEKFTDLRGELVTTGEVFQLISERAVPFRMIEEIFNDMTSAGGMFYKMQEKQAKTLAGQWANLKDSVSIMYDEIGNTAVVHGAMETLISDARSIMKNWRSWWGVIKVVSGGLIAYVGTAKAVALWTEKMAAAEALAAAAESEREKNLRRLVTSIVGKTAAENISTIATNAHTFAMNKAKAATLGLSRAFWSLAASLLTNPFGIVAVAVGGLIALFTTLKKKTRDVAQDIDNANASIEAFNKTTKETAKMIDQYDELSKKEKLTADEAKKLRDISRELAQVFPKTTEGIDQQTGALKLNLAELRQYNAEAERAIRKGMQAEIQVNNKTIRENQKEIDKLTKENIRGWGKNKALGLLSPILFPLSNDRLAENNAAIADLIDKNKQLAETNQNLQNTLDGVAEEANDAAKETSQWQDKLIEFNSRVDKEGKAILTISPDQIKNYTSLSDALDEIAKKYNEYVEEEKAMTASIEGKTGSEREELEAIRDRITARKQLAKEELDYYNAFYLTQKKSGSDDRLQRLRNEINDITNAYKKFVELRKYETKDKALSDISTLFPALKGWEPTYENMISLLENMLLRYRGDVDATRIIEQAVANIKFDEVKRSLDEKLKKLSEEIKRSETARNFFNNILDLTGDSDLAATMSMSVYGQPGEEFKERVQRELYQALNSIDPGMIDSGLLSQLLGDTTTLDFDDLYKNLDELPENVQDVIKRLRSEVESFDATLVQNLLKSIQRAKTYGEKQVEIARQTSKRIAEINSLNVSDEVKNQMLKQNAKKDAEDTAKLQYEAFKETPMYVELFANLDAASASMLKNMRSNLEALKSEWKDLDPTALKELQSRLNELDEQIARRNPFDAFISSLKEYYDLQRQQSRVQADDAAITATNRMNAENEILLTYKKEYEEAVRLHGINSMEAETAKEKMDAQASVVDDAIEEAEAAQEAANKYRVAAKHIEDAADGLKKWGEYINEAMEGIKEIVETLGSADFADTFGIISDGINKTINGASGIAGGIAQALSGNIVGGISQAISGVGNVISGIFGTASELKIKKLDNEIKRQQYILDDLEYSYQRVGNAMEKAFGADYIYNYNKQLENLYAQQEAYLAQAEAERSKGKKSDADKVKEYENAARDAMNAIEDMKSQVSEFFTGSDVTSAATEFASAWIEAYKEFGSTADAMREKFQDMIQNMIQNSLAAKIMQSILQPLFDEIDEMSRDNELSASDIAKIASDAPGYIANINNAMTTLMNQLAAAGYNVRQQVGSFTGISRNIANASEESINGLAAGINTQNFYISHIDMTVSAILSALTGGTAGGTDAAGNEVVDPYKNQMLAYVASLPQMRDDMASVRSMLEKVIRPLGTTTTHYVAVKI